MERSPEIKVDESNSERNSERESESYVSLSLLLFLLQFLTLQQHCAKNLEEQ